MLGEWQHQSETRGLYLQVNLPDQGVYGRALQVISRTKTHCHRNEQVRMGGPRNFVLSLIGTMVF